MGGGKIKAVKNITRPIDVWIFTAKLGSDKLGMMLCFKLFLTSIADPYCTSCLVKYVL